MEIILSLISVALGLAGLVYGVYQNKLKERVERLATLQAWEVYRSAYQSKGWFNNAQAETEAQKKELILAQAYAFADSFYVKTIHNIYTHHDRVTPELIDKWVSEGRLDDNERRTFLRLNGEYIA